MESVEERRLSLWCCVAAAELCTSGCARGGRRKAAAHLVDGFGCCARGAARTRRRAGAATAASWTRGRSPARALPRPRAAAEEERLLVGYQRRRGCLWWLLDLLRLV